MKWRTKDGDLLEIKDMSTGHILNCLRMMGRQGYTERIEDLEAVGAYAFAADTPDGAAMAAEAEFDYMLSHCHPAIGAMKEELERRQAAV